MWQTLRKEEVLRQLGTNEKQGLTEKEVKERQEKYGKNKLEEKKKEGFIVKFIKQFNDFMIIILIIASIISAAVSYIQGQNDYIDSIIIIAIVVLNAIMGLIQEERAEKSIESLKKLTPQIAKVIRDGETKEILAEELVIGDIIELSDGNYVPADCRIIESHNLKIEESSLTGEAEPSLKEANIICKKDIPLGDMKNMAFMASTVVNGTGKAIVTETGMETKVGQIANMIIEDEAPETPLQKKLGEVGKILGIACLAICIIIFIIGLIKKIEPIEMFMTAVGLAVAAIPEGLPAIVTIMLSIGVTKMAKRNSIIRKLPAVETLGSSNVICSDKTGTLTQNKMKVVEVKSKNPKFIITMATLCTDCEITVENNQEKVIGEPTEKAIVEEGLHIGCNKKETEKIFQRINEIPFDSNRKMMTTIHRIGSKYRIICKGAPDVLLDKCTKEVLEIGDSQDIKVKTLDKLKIKNENEQMAHKALRVIAVAFKDVTELPSKIDSSTIENNLTFVGLIGMIDPPREEAKLAVEKCKTAGIKTVMITGDHKITATAIAKKLGILENDDEAITGLELEQMTDEELEKNVRHYSVYARVSPEHKVRIVKAWQKNGEVVAMTGDGVNDSPALKKADIGCAMGIVGTDVAKEAADVILTDDNFATVVSAVEEGRRIYDNILKVIQFLLSSNVGEIIVLFFATLLTPLFSKWFGITDINSLEILLPIHILWINLVTDSLPALALAFDPANRDIMERKPVKPGKGVFTKGMTWRVIYQGMMIGGLTLAAFMIGLGTTKTPINGLTLDQSKIEVGQTMAFVTLALSELTHVFNVRNNRRSIFKTGIFNNMKLIGAVVASALLVFVILLIPGLREIFSIPVLPTENIIELVCLVLAPIAIVEIFKIFKINGGED